MSPRIPFVNIFRMQPERWTPIEGWARTVGKSIGVNA